MSFLFGYMDIVALFGGLVAFGIAVALAADVLLAPALLMVASRWRGSRQKGEVRPG